MVSDAAFAHQAPGLLENTHIGLRGFSAAQRRDKEAGSIFLYCFFLRPNLNLKLDLCNY